MVVFTMITVAGCGSPSTATPITTEHHKAIAVATMPATISSICKRTASYTFSAGYEVQKVGTEVSPSSVLSEVETYGEAFVGAKAGYALAVVNSQTYPATTLDGGLTWRINGPMLYLAAADAGQDVTEIGAAAPNWEFIWGSGNQVDFSTDGGNDWCEANLGGPVLSVGANPPDMWAILGSPPVPGQSSEKPTTYVSGDGGLKWALAR
jgi:hypothetical protein